MEIGEARRRRFRDVYEEMRKAEETRRGILPLVGPSRREKDKIHPFAISRALLDCGFLLIRRRRITPPLRVQKAADIS